MVHVYMCTCIITVGELAIYSCKRYPSQLGIQVSYVLCVYVVCMYVGEGEGLVVCLCYWVGFLFLLFLYGMC